MKLKDIQGAHTFHAYIPGQATAGTADEWPAVVVPFRGVVTAVTYTPVSAVTGAATNNFAAQLRNRGAAAAGTTDVAALTFASGTDAAAWVPTALTVDTANDEVAEGDVLTVEKVVNGTGMAMPEGVVTVTIQAR